MIGSSRLQKSILKKDNNFGMICLQYKYRNTTPFGQMVDYPRIFCLEKAYCVDMIDLWPYAYKKNRFILTPWSFPRLWMLACLQDKHMKSFIKCYS